MTKRQKFNLAAAVLLLAAIAVGLFVACKQRAPADPSGRVQATGLEDLDPIDNHPVELDPGQPTVGCEEGMIVSPSEDGSPRPGYVLVLIFKADGPFVLTKGAREKLLGVSSMWAEDATSALEQIHQAEP